MNAIILAGGKSIRFGSDKAFAKIGDSTLIESLFLSLSLVFNKIIIVTNFKERYKNFPAIITEDIFKDAGPLGGLYAGLKASNSDRNFVVACDMPLVNLMLIKYMAGLIDGDAIVPMINGKVEPLHAVYSKKCISAVEAQLKSGIYKIQEVFNLVDTRYIKEDVINKYDPSLLSFLNINLQKDMQKIKACLKY